MHKRVFGILEYDKILSMLKGHCVSDTGGQAALELYPGEEAADVKRLLNETYEAESMLIKQPSLPVAAFSDVRTEVKRLKTGASLNCAEILRAASVLKAAKRAKQGIVQDGEGILYNRAEPLFYSDELIRTIDTAILSEDEVSDDASPALRDIRRRIIRENEGVREKLQTLIRDTGNAKYLQDAIVTMRAGRFVVPVKQEHRGAVKGIVHDQSGSGQTLFVEPLAVVEANNRLRMLEAEEKAEIERILEEISAKIRPHADELNGDVSILTYLDLVFAKAGLARSMRAVLPAINESGVIDIREGRHPLIDPAKVVPVSVKLGESFKGLIITGPNTGGKTVTLKLCGLLQLMAQSGLFVPAELGTKLPVFGKIFADIGDEQSIEQSLSTFSSHMKNITSILRYADKRSLVLLDELGAGTDPAEGAALAMSILEELEKKGASVLATTHYSEIKAFALSSRFYENAGMEFDVESLSPTYRLFIGIPGLSNAFQISEKLGLKKGVIERARTLMSEESLRFNEIITEAEVQREKAQKERREAENLKNSTLELSERLKEQELRAEEKKEDILRKAREEALLIVRNARDETESIIGELKKTAAHAPADVTRAAESARKRVKLRMEGLQADTVRKRKAGGAKAEDLISGTPVHILSLDAKATVIRPPDARGNVEVQAGMMKLTVKTDDLEMAQEKDKKAYRERNSVQLAVKSISLEIDLRGHAIDEALIELDKYLDDAYVAGLTEVFVIHGKGTGALRLGIREFLRRHPHAGAFRDGRFGEGEMGVTVVSLK